MATLALWILLLASVGAFAAQVARRVQIIAAGPDTFSVDDLPFRIKRFLVDVLLQIRTIRERPVTGFMHAFVFWGFIAFGGYTMVEFLRGLGVADLTGTSWFYAYRVALLPFSSAVLLGILYLLIRRAFVRPVALGATVSLESVIIALFIATLMITFLLTFRLQEGTSAERINWWVHMVVILAFMALIPASKHLHLVLSPVTVFLKSPELGNLPNLDFEKEQVGLETVKDLGSKQRLDAFTCVECGRCQVNCPAWGAGKELNPKAIILQTQEALLAGQTDRKLGEVYSEKVLWQCTTCGACENQCPVGIEHLPILIGSRRGLVSNGDAPDYLGAMYNNLERRSNIWGLGYDQRTKFVQAAAVDTFDPAKHDVLVWLGCAGSFDADFQKSLRSLFGILRLKGVTFGVLSKERCTGDPAKRTGNEIHQELATGNIEDLKASGVKKILTSCPHCVKTIGDDYKKFGYEVEIVHSSVYVEELLRSTAAATNDRDVVTYHDPCYLGRYAGKVDEPRALLERFGADIKEPERNRDNPYCCGAGGGLLFADKEEEPGSRISDVRFKQLQATGANTVITACPFCSIMLKGAQASAQADTQFVDLMTYVNGKLQPRVSRSDWRESRSKRIQATLISIVGYPIVAALGSTLRWRADGLEHLEAVTQSGRPPIMAFWHGRILPATVYFRRRGIVVITSENFDGEWIAGIIEQFGYGTARGSTSRGGVKALVQLKRDMAAGKPAAFTLDGPRGPAKVAQPGAVWLAKATGNPVLPFHIETSRHWTLGSWDRTQIPKPFATAAIAIGAPIYVDEDADGVGIDAAARALEQRLHALEAHAISILAGR